MTDKVENVAQRLRQFLTAADVAAKTIPFGSARAGQGFQPQTNEGSRRPPSVYEECVARLSDDERDALDRILEKMRAGLGT